MKTFEDLVKELFKPEPLTIVKSCEVRDNSIFLKFNPSYWRERQQQAFTYKYENAQKAMKPYWGADIKTPTEEILADSKDSEST